MKRSIYVGVAVLTTTIAASTRDDCKNERHDKTACQSSSHGGGGSGGHGWWSGSGTKSGTTEAVGVARGGFGESAGAHGAGGE